jgi:hypothetical protein
MRNSKFDRWADMLQVHGLSPAMWRTLAQVVCGVRASPCGLIDEDHRPVNRQSLGALVQRGLVVFGTEGVSNTRFLALTVAPTTEGDALFEELSKAGIPLC